MSKLPIDKEYLRSQFSAYDTNVIDPQLQILADGIKGKISLQQNASNKGKLFIIGEDGIVGVQAPLNNYDGESPAPISGQAVKDAISKLAAEKVGGEGKFIQSIVENQGVITAIEADADFATSAQGDKADTAVQSVIVDSDGTGQKTYEGNTIILPNYPTSLPASDVPSWAKAPTKPSYNYSEINETPTIPTKLSELTNDSGYITDFSQTLEYYYTKQQVTELIETARKNGFKSVDVLPTPSEDTTGYIYLIPNGRQGENIKDEFITIQTGENTYAWEPIGSKGYVKTIQLNGISYEVQENTNTIILPEIPTEYITRSQVIEMFNTSLTDRIGTRLNVLNGEDINV